MADRATLLAEFDRPEALLAAARALRRDGWRELDACSPFPIDGLAEAIGFADNRVAWLTLAGGVFGLVAGFGLQVYTNLDYPIDVGGRPLVTWPAFLLVAFVIMVLSAVCFAVGGMLALNRLPRLSHPLFDDPRFGVASGDRFFLVVGASDPERARAALAAVGPGRIAEVAS